MSSCRHFIISGRVQGVAFRAATLQAATRLGLTGWVRNLGNGDVEALACGEPSVLAEFERWLWQGPRAARVTAVQARDVATESFDDFEIR